MRCGWGFLAEGQYVGWEEGRGSGMASEVFPNWRLSQGEELAAESINERLGRNLKSRTLNISMFTKVTKDKV